MKSSTFQGNKGVLGGGIVANDQPTGANDSVVDLRWSTAASEAVDAGGNGCPSRDQRGKPRPKGAACDIGSVER